jgi:hypothetical protein
MTDIENQPAETADEIVVTDQPEPEIIELPADEPTEAEQQPEVTEKKGFDPKTDKVDFDKPEQQEKFDYIYKQLKKSDTRNAMLTDFLEKQQSKLDELSSRFTQTDEVEAERVLMTKIRDARDAGDNDAYDQAMTELVDYRSDRKFEKKFEEKVNALNQKEQSDLRNQEQFVVKAMEETDDTGNYLRPWLQESNAQFPVALYEIRRIAAKYEGDPEILSKTLKEVDQVMSNKKTATPEPQKQTRVPNPMQGSNLTNQSPKGKIQMTRRELDIATKLGVDPKKYAARRDAEAQRNKGAR